MEYKLEGVTSLALAVGEKREVAVEGLDTNVLLVNAAGTVQALGPKCTHYGAPLVKGVLTAAGRLTCPWHGACFQAKTGDVEDAPALDALPTFGLVERDGAVYVRGDAATIKAGRRKTGVCRVPASKTTKTTTEKVVIVGGGSGAIGTIEGLREHGFTGAITVVSAEGYLPIDRPKLSKALIADPAKIQLRDAAWFDAAAVKVVFDEATAVDFAARTVTTRHGAAPLSYTKLVIATGGTARRLSTDGFASLRNIFTMRTVDDVAGIVAALGTGAPKNVVVVGSSFIGMEVANALAGRKHHVVVVGRDQVPLKKILGADVGTAAQRGLEKAGVVFHLSADVARAEPSSADSSAVGAVLLKDGTCLDADLVVLGVGVAPATSFLRDNAAIQLRPDGAVETDEAFAVSGLSGVYAVGDIAAFPYHGPAADGRHVRIEHWNVAQKAGRIAAAHILNPTKPAKTASSFFTPVFWSALAAQLRYCGNTAASGWDDTVVQGSLEGGSWAVFYTKGEAVVAVATMGKDPVMVQSSELIKVGRMPSKSELAGGLDVLSLGAP